MPRPACVALVVGVRRGICRVAAGGFRDRSVCRLLLVGECCDADLGPEVGHGEARAVSPDEASRSFLEPVLRVDFLSAGERCSVVVVP